MNILLLASNYPYSGHRFAGIFNERSAEALKEHCESLSVLAPRPYIPRFLSSILPVTRWMEYAEAESHSVCNDIAVYRPPYPQVPGIASAFWQTYCAYLFSRRTAWRLHATRRFDAILSFGLSSAGGVAWRLARDLKIPAAGWATGSDVRQSIGTASHSALCTTLENLDLVFYQSRELFDLAAKFLAHNSCAHEPNKNIVLARGITQPPQLPKREVRERERRTLGISDEDAVVVFVGRVTRSKGVLELIEAMTLAVSRNSRLRCLIVGSKPSFDDTTLLQNRLDKIPEVRRHITILPECDPEKVWDYLCAADIFAFPSHNEGMPNSLLEAMSMEVPCVACAIPPLTELEAGTGAVSLVPPFNTRLFGEAIVRLTESKTLREQLGRMGKQRVMDGFMIRKNMAKACYHLARIVHE